MAFDSRKLRKTIMSGRGSILVPHIDAYLRKGQFPKTWNIEIRNYKESDGHFHPSSDAFTPPLDLWRQKKGMIIPQPITPALRRTFDCGHMWHGYLQNILTRMGFVHPSDVEHYITHEIVTEKGSCIGAGTGDLVNVQIPGNGSWLVDIKTMNKPEFEQGANEWTMKKWQAQVSCYMDWFEADRAMVLAICKDSPHDMREYQILKDNNLLEEIYDRWVYTAQCLRDNVEPDPDYGVPESELLLNPGDSVFDATLAKEEPA
jgi:hypothetical protein